MKFSSSRSDLASAIAVVKHTVSTVVDDVTSHFVFRPRGEGAEVLSTSGRSFSSCPFVASVSEPGVVTVEGKRFQRFLSSVDDSDVVGFCSGGEGATFSVRRGSVVLPSLPPDSFPFWDDQMAQASVACTVRADYLHRALSQVRPFVYQDEGENAAICTVQVRGGMAMALDMVTAAASRFPGLDGDFRFHHKSLPHLISFLAQAKDGEVRVLSSDRCYFVLRGDGSVYGEAKHSTEFPKYTFNWESPPPGDVSFSREDMVGAIRFLTCSASSDDPNLQFSVSKESITLSMAPLVGRTPTTTTIPCTVSGSVASPFVLSHPHLTSVLSNCGETVKMGVEKRPKGDSGMVGIVNLGAPVEGMFTIAWLK